MSCFMRRCLAVPLLICAAMGPSPGELRAQGEAYGIVFDASTHLPLRDVQVYVSRLKRGTTTDPAGSYRLTGFAPGTYAVEFSHVGFEKSVRSLTFGDGAILELDVELPPQTVEGGEVIIVAEDPRHTAAIPQPTLSINQVDRLEHGLTSLWEDLDRLPGIARSTNGPGIERPFIRGLSGGRIMLLNQHLPYAYQTWDPEAGLATIGNGTEQIDVIQGPATLRYGPGAMGGVINLVPERPAPVGHTVGSFTGGLQSNTLGLYSELALKQTRKGWFWGVRGSGDSHADYKGGGEEVRGEEAVLSKEDSEEEEGRIPNSRYDHVLGQVFAGVSRSWGSSRISYQFLRHRNGIVEAEEEEGGEEEGERDIHAPYHALRDHLLTSDTQLQLGPGWMHGVLGLQINQQQEFEPESERGPGEGDEAAIDLNLTTFHFRFDYEAPVAEALSLSTGLQGFVQKNESEGLEPFVPNADRKQAGVFGLLTWKQGSTTIEGGLRYDTQSLETSPADGEEEQLSSEDPPEEFDVERSFGLLSSSVGGTYVAGEGRFFKVNVGVGNRAPDIAELTANGLLREVRRFLIGDPDVEAEYNVEGDATLGWQFPGANLSIGAFYNRIFNYIYLFSDGEEVEAIPVYRYRQADADFRGGHAGVTLFPAALRGMRLFSRVDIVVADLKGTADDALPMIPATHVLNGIEIARTGIGPFHELKLRAEVDTYLKQDRVPEWDIAGEGYSLVNLSLNARLPMGSQDVLIGLHGLNLFNTEYISNLSLLKPEGIPNMGRSINVSVRIPLGS